MLEVMRDTWKYVTQITAIGPLGLEYKNAKDDPRNKTRLDSSG